MSGTVSTEERINIKNVAVIIPCFNVQDYIADAVNSVLYGNAERVGEIICIDNNSTDNTRSVLVSLQKESSLVKLATEKKKGASAARNKGIESTTAPWVQFLDADDVLMPDKISAQLSFAEMNGSPNVAGAFVRRSVDGRQTEFIPGKEQWMALFNTRMGVTSSLLFRRNELMNAGGWNESLASSQEYELMFRMMKAGSKFLPHNELLTLVRERPHGQISQHNPQQRWENYLALRAGIFEHLEKTGNAFFQDHRKEFVQSFFDLVRTVYPHAPKVAMHYYNRYIGKDFQPQPSHVSSKAYISLHRLLGFPLTDRLKKLLS